MGGSDLRSKANRNVDFTVVLESDRAPRGKPNDGVVDVDTADCITSTMLLHRDLVRCVRTNRRNEDASVRSRSGNLHVLKIHATATFATGRGIISITLAGYERPFKGERNRVNDARTKLIVSWFVCDDESDFLVLGEFEEVRFNNEGTLARLQTEREVCSGSTIDDSDLFGDAVAEEARWKLEGEIWRIGGILVIIFFFRS